MEEKHSHTRLGVTVTCAVSFFAISMAGAYYLGIKTGRKQVKASTQDERAALIASSDYITAGYLVAALKQIAWLKSEYKIPDARFERSLWFCTLEDSLDQILARNKAYVDARTDATSEEDIWRSLAYTRCKKFRAGNARISPKEFSFESFTKDKETWTPLTVEPQGQIVFKNERDAKAINLSQIFVLGGEVRDKQ